jgi:ubiquitin-conjugating enzyme E2 G1
MALKRLMQEYKQIVKEPSPYYSIMEPDQKNIYVWEVLLFCPDPDSPFYGGILRCQFEFPKEYPNRAPLFKFLTNLPHPNIYPDGKVCISILHEGNDEFGYEHISERWNPSHSVNSVLMSIITMLASPNFESPANVDASIMWKNNPTEYKKMIYHIIAKTH